MTSAQNHQALLMQAFADVLRAEQVVSSIKTAMDEAERQFRKELNDRDLEMRTAWDKIAALMAETGEVEVILPDERHDFRIHWLNPRESVQVDAAAVPDHFCKLERKPKLKEIGDHLKSLRAAGSPLPNWACFELGTKRLTYRLVKKSPS